MSSAVASKALTNSSDANFRGWGKAISDQMATSWTQSDTGNIDWTTVTAAAGTNTAQGYEIWRSNDAAGSITQLYVKLEYGSGSAANNPSVWLTVGWGSNGSGTLTGTGLSTRKQITFTATATVSPMNLGVGTGWFCLAIGDVNNNSSLISVERTQTWNNTSHAYDFENQVLIIYNNSGTWGSQVVETGVAAYTAETTNGTLLPTSANGVVGGNYGTALVFGQKGGFVGPSLNVTGCNNGNAGAAQGTDTLTSYLASHTYKVNGNVASLNIGGAANAQLLSRFD